MRRRSIAWLGVALLMPAILMATRHRAPAAESALADTWKVTVAPPGRDVTLFIVKLKEADKKWDAETVASLIPMAKVKEVRVGDDKALHLSISGGPQTFTFVVRLPKGEDKPKKLLGGVDIGGQHLFAWLERTDAKELNQNTAVVNDPAAPALGAAMQKRDPKEKLAAIKEWLDKHGDSVSLAYFARLQSIQALAATGASEQDLHAEAERLAKLVEPYGPEAKPQADLDTEVTQSEAAGLKTLASSLRKEGGKEAQLKEVTARLTKAEEKVDQAFLKNAIPFKPEPYAGRKDNSDRLVVVELFTGSQCPPCVAADVAFDAALETYKPKDVAFLEYHLHIPGPDPMTTKDSEARSEYYGIQGTPTAYVDGKETPPLGGGKGAGKRSYDELTGKINGALGTKPAAKLDLKADRQGDVITIHANASDVSKDAKDVRLRLVVAEAVVRYAGPNGQRFHHHVVRAMPGGAEGITVKDGSAKQEVKVDVAEIRKALEQYLTDFEKQKAKFPDDSRPLALKDLIVVALLQSNANKEVLGSAQVEVGHGK
jgi:hypothetical protein